MSILAPKTSLWRTCQATPSPLPAGSCRSSCSSSWLGASGNGPTHTSLRAEFWSRACVRVSPSAFLPRSDGCARCSLLPPVTAEVSSYLWQIICSYLTAPAIERRQQAEGELRGHPWTRSQSRCPVSSCQSRMDFSLQMGAGIHSGIRAFSSKRGRSLTVTPHERAKETTGHLGQSLGLANG